VLLSAKKKKKRGKKKKENGNKENEFVLMLQIQNLKRGSCSKELFF
jgi:hypothetical protein